MAGKQPRQHSGVISIGAAGRMRSSGTVHDAAVNRAPSVRRAARQTALGLAVTEETKARLLAIGTRRVELFSAMGLDRAAYESLSGIPAAPASSGQVHQHGAAPSLERLPSGLKAFSAAARSAAQSIGLWGMVPSARTCGAWSDGLGLDRSRAFLGFAAAPRRARTARRLPRAGTSEPPRFWRVGVSRGDGGGQAGDLP